VVFGTDSNGGDVLANGYQIVWKATRPA